MLVQHKIKLDSKGLAYVEKEYVREVNMGSVKNPSDILFFEYIGGV